MKILVPTDFSDCSKIAVRYAVGLARQLQAELILLHVLPSPGPAMGRQPSDRFKELLLEWRERAERQFSALEAANIAEGLPLTHRVAYGDGVEKVVERYIRSHAIGLVVMGSKGASGLKKMVLGSNTVGVINHSGVPVVVVPEHAVSAPITHLVYASNLKKPGEEVEALLPYARRLQAAIKIIHIALAKSLQQPDTEKMLHTLRQKTGYQAIELELLQGEDIAATIEQYAAASHGGILVLFTRPASFLEKLCHHSITREIAWHSQVPLLVINNRE